MVYRRKSSVNDVLFSSARREHRDRFAPKLIGHRPTRLFVNVDGTPKTRWAVASTTSLKRRAGIVITPHQFRHLSAKIVLDADPAGFETVKQFLGHTSLKTTVGAYAGIDSRRAARRHHYLVEQALAAEILTHRSKAARVVSRYVERKI